MGAGLKNQERHRVAFFFGQPPPLRLHSHFLWGYDHGEMGSLDIVSLPPLTKNNNKRTIAKAVFCVPNFILFFSDMWY